MIPFIAPRLNTGNGSLFYVPPPKKKSMLGAALLVRQVEPLRRLQIWRSGRRLSPVFPSDYYSAIYGTLRRFKQLSNRGPVRGGGDRLEPRSSASKAGETRLISATGFEPPTPQENKAIPGV